MALRLTPTGGTPSPGPAAPHGAVPPASPAAALAARAREALARRDVAGYGALFAEARAVADVHRRWEARRALIRHGLTAKGSSPAVVGPVFAAVAEAGLALLAEEPREPILLNETGVALYELGALDGAQALFEAALRLDPELPHARGNVAEIERRRAAGLTTPVGLPAHVAARLRELAARARSIAATAVPAEGLTLSLCMIVRDEEEMLGRCLAAAAPAVDEIVVVDTGSVDRTVEIAQEHGARVLHHEWDGDFAAARNVAFDAATGDWVMYLDADEILVDGDAEALRDLTGKTWREAFYLVETNHTGDLDDGTAVTHDALRVFRNRPEYRFEGRVHEQIAHNLPGYLPERLERTRVRVDHYGYLGAIRDAKKKSRRNIELLEKQVAEGVDTPFLHFNLGSEHAAAGDSERAHEHFERAWSEVLRDPQMSTYGYVPSLAARYVKSLRVTGRLDRVDETAEQILRIFPGFTDVVYEQAFSARARGDRDTAIALFRRCLDMGDAGSRYSATVGCGSFLAACALAEVHLESGEWSAAEQILRHALAEHPSFVGVAELLSVALMRAGTPAADAVAEVERIGGELSPTAAFLVGVAAYEAGAADVAASLLERTLAAQPRAHAARVILAEARLTEGDLAAAARLAEEVPADAPVAAAAARTALFARLAADETVSDEALAAAEAVGLPAAEVAAVRSWRDASARTGALPPGSAGPILTMLDALARLERFDAFEQLAGAFETVDVPWRERREALARLYLRRGFLESAADEWIGVVERDGPDVRAFAGLAEVALARELPDDARLFAAEAAALDPEWAARPPAALVAALT